MKRYRLDPTTGLHDDPNGWLVKFKDAEAEIERLDAKVERLEVFLDYLKKIGEQDDLREVADICGEALGLG